MSTESICLTQYSHGGGCGCKIAPNVLETILSSSHINDFIDPHLLVGNETKDDAAVYDIGNGQAIISTTDFFMPIVDDPFDFGRIAATNAISDIYAMGGRPIMAIAILGWPINKLPAEVAAKVIEGGRSVCQLAGISLAGGHSIDCPEPVFGLAVTGIVPIEQVKRNNTAISGCHLLLSKPLGIGVLTTAEKKRVLLPEDRTVAVETMCKLNQLGQHLSTLPYVKAMTDVTGFGLLGHLTEICQGAELRAEINFSAIPTLPNVIEYISKGCVSGGTLRNYSSYGHLVGAMTQEQRDVLCDPQTSGGLLIAVEAEYCQQAKQIAQEHGECLYDIGQLYNQDKSNSLIEINS